jgi:formamidopyrimidine-DNA glycosylase
LLADLGPEPLGNEFSGEHLFQQSRKRRIAVKNHIMDSKVVVGVGNIYAAEALFTAGIRPTVQAGKVTRVGYDKLAGAIAKILARAIKVGGTTLRDFVGSDGQPGYFRQSLNVYGRGGEPCRVCSTALKGMVLGQRSTVYCPQCQVTGGWK